MTNPTAAAYRSPRPHILRPGESAEIARFTRAARAEAMTARLRAERAERPETPTDAPRPALCPVGAPLTLF